MSHNSKNARKAETRRQNTLTRRERKGHSVAKKAKK